MTEKIEWYREVLELEPNSKVFLPLAKLLVEENEDSQAIDILQRGLDRHPDFLEARLFLIELLYKMGKKDECDAEVKKLGKMFATYAGFWQAWAACLSGDNEQDTASVLRFLAATFLHGPLSLHDVLNRGLASYIPDARMGAPKLEAQSQTPVKDQTAEAENEALAGEAPGQLDIEHANNQALDEIVQPATEEAPVEAVEAEKAEESPETAPTVAGAKLPAEDMTAEQEPVEAAESPAAQVHPADAAQEEQVAAEVQAAEEPEAQAAQEEPTQEVEARQEEETAIESQVEEQPTQEAQAATEEPGASEEQPGEEHASAEPTESLASMAEEAAPEEPPAREEDMVSNAAEVEASSSEAPAITEEPVAQENIEAAPEQAPVMAEENQATEAQAQPEMQQEALAASQEDALPGPEELPSTEQVSAESMPPTLEEIREAAYAEADDVVGTGGESLQALFERNIAPENTETPQATESMPGQATELPVAETAQRAEQAEELPAEEYTPKFKDSGEQYTVRTRSMAEVLAEQDDLKGALEIYRELLAAAPEGAEKNDLQLRISTLTQKLREAEEAAQAPVEYEPGSVSSRSREKLISMLEALARRVEARAQS